MDSRIMKTVSSELTLTVKNVNLKIKDKAILHDIWMSVKTGELIALMGPTGCGKTTLLNIIAGRQQADSGTVTLNNAPFNKRQRRRLAFVQQQDVFFSQLTLWETLWFTAQLRLPGSLSHQEKKDRIYYIVDMLNIRKCLETVIGDSFVRGLSGGEKKRASVACELLVDPDILLMDEPTSGLDSSTSVIMMKAMKELASSCHKMIVVSIHQPSGQIFYLFDKLILLHEGQVMYFGAVGDALSKVGEVGLWCQPHYNPADFYLDLCHGEKDHIEKLKKVGEECIQELVQSLEHRVKDPSLVTRTETNPTVSPTASNTEEISEDKALLDRNREELENTKNGHAVVQFETEVKDYETREKWPTSWWIQFKVLSGRSLRQATRDLLQGYSLAIVISVTVVTAVIYYDTGLSLDTHRDLMGMFFFNVGYWTFLPAMETLSSFPEERGVVDKERASGAYRLSAYFFAKMISHVPLLIEPFIMFTAIYWSSGVVGVGNFFATLAIMLMQTLACYAFGLVVAVLFSNVKLGITVMFSYFISGYIAGGFFTRHMPKWMAWLRYITPFYYPYSGTVTIIMSEMSPTPCNVTNAAEFPVCAEPSREYVYAGDVLKQGNIEISLVCILMIIGVYTVVFWLASYIALRFRKRPPV